MIYRVVNEDRMQQVRDLWDYCFEKKDDPFFQYYFEEYCGKNNMVIGAFEKVGDWERLRSMVHINPYMLRLRGREELTPYLVGVATAPEARGRHAFGPLLQTAFEVLRSQNFSFVTLMPVFAGIYLPYEFSYCYYRHAYQMPLTSLSFTMGDDGLQAEREPLRQEILAPLYARLTAAWNGVPVRTDFQWNKLLTVHGLEQVQCAVVYRQQRAVGYMLYKVAEERFTIIELLAEDFAVRKCLLGYAAMHQSSAKELYWLAEAWDKTYLGFKDQSLSGRVQPFMMARCIDARTALAKLTAPQDLPEDSVVLLLTDKLIDRNNHLLKLKTAPGSLEAVSTLDAEEVTMDMGAFTQLYMGAFSAAELWEAGRLKAAAPEKLALLDKLFPKCRTYNNEYF